MELQTSKKYNRARSHFLTFPSNITASDNRTNSYNYWIKISRSNFPIQLTIKLFIFDNLMFSFLCLAHKHKLKLSTLLVETGSSTVSPRYIYREYSRLSWEIVEKIFWQILTNFFQFDFGYPKTAILKLLICVFWAVITIFETWIFSNFGHFYQIFYQFD